METDSGLSYIDHALILIEIRPGLATSQPNQSSFEGGAIIEEERPATIRFLPKIKLENKNIVVPLGIPPLTISTDKDATDSASSIKQHVDTSVTAALAYITNELG